MSRPLSTVKVLVIKSVHIAFYHFIAMVIPSTSVERFIFSVMRDFVCVTKGTKLNIAHIALTLKVPNFEESQ